MKPELVDISIEFVPGDEKLTLTVRGIDITYGNMMKLRTAKGIKEVKCFLYNEKTCPAPIIEGKVKLRILADRASMELYANDGLTVTSSYEFDIPENLDLKFSAGSQLKINTLVVNELES